MNLPGRIYAHQLTPIAFDPTKNQTRESISLELRVQMLEAVKHSPEDAGSAISWGFRVKNVTAIAALLMSQYWVYQVPCSFLMERLHINFAWLSLHVFGVALVATIVLYFFKIYLPNRGKAVPRSPSKKDTTPVKPKTKSKKID
jgi:hypothetical protein